MANKEKREIFTQTTSCLFEYNFFCFVLRDYLAGWAKKIPQPIRIGAKRNETKLFAYIIFVFDEYFYFTH